GRTTVIEYYEEEIQFMSDNDIHYSDPLLERSTFCSEKVPLLRGLGLWGDKANSAVLDVLFVFWISGLIAELMLKRPWPRNDDGEVGGRAMKCFLGHKPAGSGFWRARLVKTTPDS